MSNGIYNYQEDDPKMAFAIEEAQRTLEEFFDAYSAPKDNQEAFLLKVLFENEGDAEHIWMADIDASVFLIEGTVANEPNLDNLNFMDRTTFHPSKITDWMYVEDGYLVGGYTIQVIRSSLSPDEKLEYDKNAPYKFRD